MWSDEKVAERVARDFVPLLIDVDKDQDTAARYGISAMPTLVIADAAGEVQVKSVGAPFDNPKGALKWFDDVAQALEDLPALEKTFNESKNADVAAATKLADAYSKLGHSGKARKVYEAILEGREPKDAAVADVRLKLADLLMQNDDPGAASSQLKLVLDVLPKDDKRVVDVRLKLIDCRLYADDTEGLNKEIETLYVDLLKAKDERAIDAAMKWTQVVLWFSGEEDEGKAKANGLKARGMFLDCAKELKDSKRAIEAKFFAAYVGHTAGEVEAAKKEMKEIAAAGIDPWSDSAKQVLEQWESPDTPDEEGNG